MNCPIWVHAPLVIIENGTIRVDGIKNKPIERINKDALKWDVYLETDIVLYSAILTKRQSLVGVVKKWLKGEIKIKGIVHVLDLIKLFNCLLKEKLIYNPPSE